MNPYWIDTRSLVTQLVTIVQDEDSRACPGWIIFRNLRMSNGTLYIVRDDPLNDEESDFATVDQWPLVRMMTSTGLPGYATEESVKEREPTDQDIAFITPTEAASQWGENIYPVSGTSVSTHLSVYLPPETHYNR